MLCWSLRSLGETVPVAPGDPSSSLVSTTTTTTSSPAAIPDVSVRTRQTIALALVYVLWGSTYLAMRYAVAGLPPLVMVGTRFVIAGGVLLAIARARGVPMPTAREWRGAALVGALFFLGGNGLVAISEQSLGSGLAAVVCATMPLWLAVMSALAGDRPARREWLGLAIGFAGVVVLAGGADVRANPLMTIVLALSPVSWAMGSFLARRVALPRGLAAAGAEMLAGGVISFAIAFASGERVPTAPSGSSVLALGYLIVAGSLLGFTAFAWLLANARPAVATSYAFVNPALAVALGAVVGGEPLGVATLAGTVLIIASVALIVLRPGRRRS
jgi:drug/metabolite transporter (DMT)-like permease